MGSADGGAISTPESGTEEEEVCNDQPRSSESCQNAIDWGFCGQDWFAGYCRASCGLCTMPGTGDAASAGASGNASSGVGDQGSGGTDSVSTSTGGTSSTGPTPSTDSGNTGGTTGPNSEQDAADDAESAAGESSSIAPGGKFVGNITTGNGVDSGGRTFSTYWNQITPENAGKWGSVQSSAGASFNWGTLDAVYDYAAQKGILFKQHTFVWGSQQPSGSIGEDDVKSWISSFCQRYPDTPLIDVVNEPPPHTEPSYANAIGGGTNGSWQWVTNAFKWARQYCPNSTLILNDYNNIEWSNDASHFREIVKTALAAGAPIDAIGAQSHDLDHGSVTLDTVKNLLTLLHEDTGLPVYITELDISTSDDAAQLSAYQKYIPYFMGLDYVPGITIWGWIYGQTWSQAPESGLIRDGSARPAMTWLMEYLGRPSP